jgi:hypothetical protein
VSISNTADGATAHPVRAQGEGPGKPDGSLAEIPPAQRRQAMRSARLLLIIASLAASLCWTARAWAAAEGAEDRPNDANIELNDNMSYWDQGMAPAPDTGTKFESAVITGTVVGSNCWLARGLEGDKYRDSAIACARNGTPLTILTDDGSLVLPIALGADGNAWPDNGKVMPYVEKRVKAYGVTVRRGHERGILIDSVAVISPPKKPRTFETRQIPNSRITGNVVDLACWLKAGNTLTSDPKCVGECATAGDPLVVATKDGRVYYPVSMTMPTTSVGTAKLLDYCAQRVRVYGTAIARGQGRAMIISKVEPYPSK